MAQKFGNKQKVKGAVLKRSRRRAQRLVAAGKMPRGVSPKGGITGREARALKRANARLKGGQGPAPGKGPAPYDPLKQLTGKDFAAELKATQGYEFGDQERELQKEGSRLGQVYADRGSYYDDYKQALTESVGRIRQDSAASAAASQTQIDNQYAQQKSEQEARDAEDAAVATQFARPATPSQEGQRAVEARRFMAQSEAARQRSTSDARLAESDQRIPNSLLKKAEDLRNVERRQGANRGDQIRLAQKKGEFATKYRADVREGEREWAAIQKEFKLESGQNKADRKLKRMELGIEKLKSFNQLKQAMLYAGAKNHMARAIVAQAKKMADAKIISASQQKEIARIYANSPNKSGGGGSGSGAGSGAGGSFQPWEKDKISNAVNILRKKGAKPQGRATWMKRMQNEGVPLRLARVAWNRYEKKYLRTGPHDTGAHASPLGPK